MKHRPLFHFIIFLLISSTSFGQSPLIEWQATLGGSDFDFARSIGQTTDGGFIVLGTSRSNDVDLTENNGSTDYWVAKLNSTGNLIWQRSIGGSNPDDASSIQQTTDGGYIVAGTSASIDGDVTGNHGGQDFWIVKLGASGTISWEKSFGGSSSDIANSVQQTSDGGYIVVGRTSSIDGDVTGNQGNTDVWIVKLDALGNLMWEKTFGGTNSEAANSISQTTDGGYVFAGYTSSNDGNISVNIGSTDYWIVKLDSTGSMTWEKTFGGSNQDMASSIQLTADNGYIVGGSTLSNDGHVTGHLGDLDGWITKLDSNGNLIWQKSLGSTNWDKTSSIIETSQGGYIAAGETDVNLGFNKYSITMLDANGEILTDELFGGTSNDYATSILQTTNGGYIVAGTSSSNDNDVLLNNGLSDIWILKFGMSLHIEEQLFGEKEIVKILNLLGQETSPSPNTPLIYIFADGTTQKVMSIE